MFIIGVLGDNRKYMILAIQVAWWMTGVAAIIASVMLFYSIPVALVMRDTCKVALNSGPD
jgi:hypothetical protein